MGASRDGVQDEDDHSLADVEPLIKEETELLPVKPAVPQLELSRCISDSDDEGQPRGVSVKNEPEDESKMDGEILPTKVSLKEESKYDDKVEEKVPSTGISAKKELKNDDEMNDKRQLARVSIQELLKDSDEMNDEGQATEVTVKEERKDDDEMDDDDDDDKRGAQNKIKVAYIENRRARGATFNKRRNGILKKAYELSELTGTVVCAVVFNEQRNKMYEYCSGEPSEVFMRIAKYYGYCERRRNETLRTPYKGYINIGVNEPSLAAAARAAAATAAIRHAPRRITAVQQKRNKHNNVKVPAIPSEKPTTPPSMSGSGDMEAEEVDRYFTYDEQSPDDEQVLTNKDSDQFSSTMSKMKPEESVPPNSTGADEDIAVSQSRSPPPPPPPPPSNVEA